MEEALLLHPNYMMLMWDSVEFFKNRPDLIEHGLKRMGYRLLPEMVEIPNASLQDGYVTIKHRWRNLGAGRFCSEGRLKIRIRGCVTEDRGFDPGSLSEGEEKEYSTPVRLPQGAEPGEHEVEFAVCGYGGSHIRLPLDGR